MDASLQTEILHLQQNEIDGHHTYLKLAAVVKDEKARQILTRIAADEMKHYAFWKTCSGVKQQPNWLRINAYVLISRLFGLTFGLKLMELGEVRAQQTYTSLAQVYPQALDMLAEEERHESELLEILNEEALKYAGSVVLGLNDALVEFTGTLAGLTFAFQNPQLIALAGFINGVSASFSMASSEYLSQKSEGGELKPLRAAIYTGVAYMFTVFFLVLPYLLFQNYLVCLAVTIFNAVLVIAVFNFYISVARGFSFRRRFTEMTAISLGVAAISFIVGMIIRTVIGIDI